LPEDDRRRFEQFIERVVITPSGRASGMMKPVAERVG
jgi:hypothetical protein